jgi:hypothetical protein
MDGQRASLLRGSCAIEWGRLAPVSQTPHNVRRICGIRSMRLTTALSWRLQGVSARRFGEMLVATPRAEPLFGGDQLPAV